MLRHYLRSKSKYIRRLQSQSWYFSSIEIYIVQYKTVSRDGIGMVFIWYKFKHEGMKVSLLI